MSMQPRLRPSVLAMTLAALLAGAASSVPGWPGAALAQQSLDDGGGDASGMVVRMGRLEEQVRALTGQIEQLQYQNRKLEDALRKMQGDVDFRLQDLEHPGGAQAPARPAAQPRRSDAAPDQPAAVAADATPASPAATTDGARSRRTGDAFDPSADPSAPGAPRPLGTTTPSAPLPGRATRGADARSGPLNLMPPGATPAPVAADQTPAVAPSAGPGNPNAVASLTPGGTREEFDADFGLYRQGQYDSAATGFQSFASKYPKDRMVPDALFLAGESYARLGRHREAAEQFLKVSTDYSKSNRAPDALLKLGVSLNALGAKDQACATYLEVTRRYPTASADVRAAVDREVKRARCSDNG